MIHPQITQITQIARMASPPDLIRARRAGTDPEKGVRTLFLDLYPPCAPAAGGRVPGPAPSEQAGPGTDQIGNRHHLRHLVRQLDFIGLVG